MSTKKKFSFEILPVELVHRVFDQLDNNTIIYSIRCVCKRLHAIANIYNRYELDFRFMSKSDLPVMAHIIDPKNIISITLTDGIRTRSQIRLFLFYFHIHKFIRLRSLTLIDVKEQDLDKFQKHIMQYPLKTFSISFRYCYEEKILPLLSSIMFQNDLRKFEYKGTEQIFNKIQWSISYHVEHLAVFCDCCWRTVYSILSHLRCLRTLILKEANKYESDKFINVQTNITQSTCLTSLSLETYTNITMNDIESLLLLLPKLTHLRLIGQDILTDPSLFDGSRWENFIKTKLSLLNRFEFRFTRSAVDNADCTTVESLIAAFRTSFWLETKH
ncbi:unnamed protein product [Rotaria sp. Silwood1]|nr:unnamed protein product [Rotaria sp. Silwood1]CAF4885840.1 unnamed protein product [Rotaria sp. Silwood1]